ncbi:MAG: polyphosphate kinase 2 [Saprospiraceae bacterium]
MTNFTIEDFRKSEKKSDLIAIANKKDIDLRKTLSRFEYEETLRALQIELVNLQHWVAKNKKRVAIIFEGRDAAGKGGAIKRFAEHLSPRSMRIVALSKPTDVERGQWYFRRYIKEMPNPGEMVFFDRSWYNRAVVEPVMEFCNQKQYQQFMTQVPEFEQMMKEDGVQIIKFWFSITKSEQKRRFKSRLNDPLKIWKFSPVDEKGQKLWKEFSHYKEQMFSRTHTPSCPWIIVKTNDKRTARLETIRYVLSQFDYSTKKKTKPLIVTDPNVIIRYHRNIEKIGI